MSNKRGGQQEGQRSSLGDDLETEMIPADEMSITERNKANYQKENINNDSLLSSFYKRKIEDKRTAELTASHQRLYSQSQEDNKMLAHRTTATLKYRPEYEKSSDSLSNKICFI